MGDGQKEDLCQEHMDIKWPAKDVRVVSLYAFSTENWNRPKDEITKLFEYLDDFFNEYINEFVENNCRIQVSGDISKLPENTQKTIQKAIEITKDYKDYVFNICLNYGGRQEIVRGVKLALRDIQDGKINVDDLNIDTFKNYLYTHDLPEIDLMVRTSGEERISNTVNLFLQTLAGQILRLIN